MTYSLVVWQILSWLFSSHERHCKNMKAAQFGDGQIGIATQGKGCLELAAQEARSLGHHYLGTEHLLLREEEGLADQVLLKSGVTARQGVRPRQASARGGTNNERA